MYNKRNGIEDVKYVIEAVENLGTDGFCVGDMDDEFVEKRNELKDSLGEVIHCIDWLNENLYRFTYFSLENCFASYVKSMIQSSTYLNISLGCVIAALLYLKNKVEVDSDENSTDLRFRLPWYEREELAEKSRRWYSD